MKLLMDDCRDVDYRACLRLLEQVGLSNAMKIMPEHQRKVTRAHVVKLRRLMDDGEYLRCSMVLARMPNGAHRCANGMHSMLAMTMRDNSVTPIRVDYSEYACSDEVDWTRLFHSFDTEDHSRTWFECATVVKQSSTHLGDISATTLNAFRSGLEWLLRYTGTWDSRAYGTKYKRFTLVDGYLDECRGYAALLIQSQIPEILRRTCVSAAIVACWQEDAPRARTFWSEVATGLFSTTSDKGYPPYKLHQWLRKYTLAAPTSASKFIISREQMFVGCMNCWNAFVGRRSITIIKTNVGSARRRLDVRRATKQG